MLERRIRFEGKTIYNAAVLQPMEGCNCLGDGSPSPLTVEKYLRSAKSGAGTIWFEANAVCKEGRATTRQMMITHENLKLFKELVSKVKRTCMRENGFEPFLILQLTHSGRHSISPMIAYRNALLEKNLPASDGNVVTDEYLDTLPEAFAESARLAGLAGFDGVDVKSCHGYLLQELLSGYEREGCYGGTFENRSRLYLDCIRKIKESLPGYPVVTRLGVSDMIRRPYGFGTTENGSIDLTEPKMLITRLASLGVKMINVTIGNPYYNPHVNRPYRSGAYIPPEAPEHGLQRFWDVEAELKSCFPEMLFVGTGLSFYREELFGKAESMLENGVCDLIGFGRVSIAYPMFYRDYLSGRFDFKKCCVACSKCTFLMRNGCASGCAVFDERYKKIYDEYCRNSNCVKNIAILN